MPRFATDAVDLDVSASQSYGLFHLELTVVPSHVIRGDSEHGADNAPDAAH
jgi:hypothetical protein